MRLSLTRVNVPELVQSVVEASEASITDRGVSVDLRVDADCPVIRADPARLQQIASNLLGNAIKFSPPGSAIAIALKPEGAGLRLSFSDHGVGIAKEFLPDLFDRFSQADAGSNRRHGGLGLGLSIVKHLVDLHDGEVHASSAGEGQGTSMVVDLPALPPAEAPATDAGPETEGGPEVDDVQLEALHGLHVLLVEDDAEASEMMTLVLSERGARVRAAADYDSAIAALQQDWPDVLVSDIGLPGRDGYELVRRVRAIEREQQLARLPVIALTAFARPEDRRKTLDAGFDLHLSKPLRPHLLLDAIVRVRPAGRT